MEVISPETKCQECCKWFESPESLWKHRQSMHIECKLCPRANSFSTVEFLKLHIQKSHPTVNLCITEEGDRGSFPLYWYECQECDKLETRKSKMISPTDLKQHIEEFHGSKNFPCQFCNKEFTHRSTLFSHKKREHENLIASPNNGETQHIKCNLCPKANLFSTVEFLKQHVQKEHPFENAYDYACENGGKSKQTLYIYECLECSSWIGGRRKKKCTNVFKSGGNILGQSASKR